MHTQTSKVFRPITDGKVVTFPRSPWYRIRTIMYWIFTVIIVFELVAGSMWNLLQIEWVRLQLNHLGYPPYFAYILGVWHIGGAAAIIAPRFPRLKEWAYAGCFFLWSSAVASHLLAGDGVQLWVVPLMFATFAIGSWALRPVERRLPNAELAPETRPFAWAVSIGTLLLLFVVFYLTLPAVNAAMHQRAHDLGWDAPGARH
jgi:DoxX-like family